MDIGAWLRGLGLGQYEQAFRDHDVDPVVLPDLTAEDLVGLGVTSIGHRRKLLAAMATLQSGASRPEAAANAVPPARSGEAERRQLTVMFADLVASTALAVALDPEDLREVISAYHSRVAGVVARYDGYVAKFLGDGVLAYFGYPRAHEEDAERAVHAGLEIVAATGKLAVPDDLTLHVRVGIATGPAVVGDLIGEGAARGEAVGETPNLAARLQALAEPDSVVISRRTQRLVEGLFELGDLGVHELKGFAAPVRAWRVLGPTRTEGRFEARHAKGLTPLVGREQELGLLLDRWQRAKEGEGQVVLLSGEAGIGKSRLVQALREQLAGDPYMGLSHFCSPFHQTSALHPVVELLERAAGLARDDPPERKLDKLETLLARSRADVAAAAPLIAALLSIPAGDRYPALDLTPQRQKEETLNAFLALLAGFAAERPVLLLCEDVHWADASTIELMELVIQRVRRLPILVLVTFRPDFAPPWREQAHIIPVTLARLSHSLGAAIVAELTGGKPLPPQVLQEIVARTDGVPLFVEELTKAVLESGAVRDAGDRYALAGPLPPLAIPPTLHDSLTARLDRLAPVKEVAQIAAVIGRQFGYELLAAVAPLDHAALQDALRQLADAELVFGQGAPPHASYVFKHALVRDAAYESLLKSRRHALHARVVAALEERFPDVATAQPELVARHCVEAGLVDKAVGYWLKAGQQALARSATTEAIAQLTHCLELLARLPDGSARDHYELEVQTTLGGALIAAKGHAAPETGHAYARARELCRRVGDTARLLPLLFGLWVFHMARAEHGAARDLAEELLRCGEQSGDATGSVIGHRAVGISSLWRGEPGEARGHLKRMLALYDPQRQRSLARVYAYDPRLAGLTGLSFALFQLGYPAQAAVRCREAVDAANAMSHPAGLAYVLHQASMLAQLRGDGASVRELTATLIALAAEQDFAYWQAVAVTLEGWALAERGRGAEGIARMEAGLAAYRATGAAMFLPYLLALLSEAHGAAGRVTEALGLLSDALARVDATGERWFEAELHRHEGEALLALAPERFAEVETCYRPALAVARAQGAKTWELRAATSLARLWRDQGRRDAARDLLARVYCWFTEGFENPDLRKAKALLDVLT